MEVFEGPQLTPPTISLLTAADIIPMTGDRWDTGFDLINEGTELGGSSTGGVTIYRVCHEPEELMYAAGAGSNEAYVPYVLYASDKCSTWPAKREFYDRAQRKLLAGESFFLELQLWQGLHVIDASLTNPYLADGPGTYNTTATQTLPLTATSAKEAMAILEQKMGDVSTTRGMIHIRPQVLFPLLEAQVVRRVGNVYLSPMDNIVVPGRGYPGTGPANEAVGATEWMFGHPGIVQVRRGPVIRLGEDDLASQVDRYVNDRQVFVQRVVHVALDTTKGVFAIEFNSIS